MLARVAFSRTACLSVRAASTTVSVLDNGIRVVTDNQEKLAATIAIAVRGGAAAQSFSSAGVAHLTARAAFQGGSIRSSLAMVRELEGAGASVVASAGREELLFTGETLQAGVPQLVSVLGEALSSGRVEEFELEQATEGVKSDISIHQADGIATTIDLLHSAAFRESGLGLSTVAPAGNVSKLGVDSVRDFRNRTFVGKGIVVAASGVSHATLLESVKQTFGSIPEGAIATANSKYIGGEVRVASTGPLSAVGLAFEGAKISADNVFTLAVVQSILGSFRAPVGLEVSLGVSGGLLNRAARDGYILDALSFSANYAKSGLFGVVALGPSKHTARIFDNVLDSLKSLRKQRDAVQRAKNQLRARLFFEADQRTLVAEDMARQLLATEKVLSPSEIASKIDAVTESDVQSAIGQLLSSPVSLAAIGDVSVLPSAKEIQSALQ